MDKPIIMPVGISDFEEVRRKGMYYVDQTDLVEKLIGNYAEATLILRPHSFGKTMNLSMLESFFSIEKDSKDLFAGLKISEYTELCTSYMNQYPTIFITFQNMKGEDFETAFESYRCEIRALYKKFEFLLESDKLSTMDKESISAICNGTASDTKVMLALSELIRLLYYHYNKDVILLIDGYDAPLENAAIGGYYGELANVMYRFEVFVKDNNYLKFAVIAGSTYSCRASIFSGTNLYIKSINERYIYPNEYFGFSESEVKKILADCGMSAQDKDVKEWYGGYNIGGMELYCPKDVILYVNDFLSGKVKSPKCYWDTVDGDRKDMFPEWLAKDSGVDPEVISGRIQCMFAEGTVGISEMIHHYWGRKSEDRFWTHLFFTGYLTVDERYIHKGHLYTLFLKIPNKEIRGIFEKVLKKISENRG